MKAGTRIPPMHAVMIAILPSDMADMADLADPLAKVNSPSSSSIYKVLFPQVASSSASTTLKSGV
jgi:hypothetical protein